MTFVFIKKQNLLDNNKLMFKGITSGVGPMVCYALQVDFRKYEYVIIFIYPVHRSISTVFLEYKSILYTCKIIHKDTLNT